MANAGPLDKPLRPERPDSDEASRKPAGSEDRPGFDLGGAGREGRSAPLGQPGQSRSVPDPAGSGPHAGAQNAESPVLTEGLDVETPETGANAPGRRRT